jgi:predicted RNA polymerase sigma factor
LSINKDQGVRAQAPLLHRVKGNALQRVGDIKAAREAFEKSLQLCRSRAEVFQTALTLQALADPSVGGSAEQAAEAAQIFDRLGVLHP